MPRPVKKGLSYFPLDTDFMRDRKVQRLILAYGADGIAVFIGVLCEVYMTNGYYLPVTEEVYFDIGFTLQMSEERVKMIVDYCVKIRLFDDKMFNSKRILTSVGVQQRYLFICKQLKRQLDKGFLIAEVEEVNSAKTGVFSEITGVSSVKTPVSSGDNPTKGKGNKKEIKKEKKKEIKKEINYENKQSGANEKDQPTDDGATARRQELLQMAREAAAGDRHA